MFILIKDVTGFRCCILQGETHATSNKKGRGFCR